MQQSGDPKERERKRERERAMLSSRLNRIRMNSETHTNGRHREDVRSFPRVVAAPIGEDDQLLRGSTHTATQRVRLDSVPNATRPRKWA